MSAGNDLSVKTKTSGLMLISMYSDDESEEDNAAEVGCQGGESFIKLTENTPSVLPHQSNRLPLPSTITQLYKDKVSDKNPQDDPTYHDGRIRSFPHERGNWSTYVYVPYEVGEGFDEMLDSLSSVAQQGGLELKVTRDPHISLTRTVVLLHHWINSFVSSVRDKLSHIPRFSIVLGPPAVYCNEERTRTFLGLKVETGHHHLCEMAHILDGCLSEFRLPPFYKDPQFHMSVLWMVGDFQDKLEALLPKLQAEFSLYASENSSLFYIDVIQCLCKTGNKVFNFPLASL